jgi:uncharacterized protein YlxP (DUF503 family)
MCTFDLHVYEYHSLKEKRNLIWFVTNAVVILMVVDSLQTFSLARTAVLYI